METLGNESLTKSCSKVALNFCCLNCDYFTDKKSSFDKHLLTSKHTSLTNVNTLAKSFTKIEDKLLPCKNCNKCFKSRVGLWKHNKKGSCYAKNDDINNNSPSIDDCETQLIQHDKDNLILMILKQNADLIKEQSNLNKQNTDLIKEQSNLIKEQADIKQIIMELVKNGINNTNNNTINNNSHNKAFNLNFFLNDTCKNAMNINEFLDSIQLELNDLMELGELGYVASMSKIIAKNLNALDETIRPIHCTDTKREIFYIKDDNKWEKEDIELKKLRKLILKLSLKPYKLLPQYREKFPDYNSSTSTHSDEHCIIIMEAMTCDKLKDEKIIRNISKVTTISK